jgi:hypothetical protein
LKPSLLYRISAVLLALFAAGHTLGFREADPQWGVDSVIALMRAKHFDVQGFSRTYWDFFVGSGFFVGAFLLFAAILAWQLAGIDPQTCKPVSAVAWSLAILFVALAVLSWMYLFIVPLVFSGVIASCLLAAAWLSSARERRQA